MNNSEEKKNDFHKLASKYIEASEDIGSLTLKMLYYQGLSDFELTTWQSDTHNHSKYEIIILFEGNAILGTHNGELALEKNDICIIPPVLDHFSRPISSNQRKISIRFSYQKNKCSQKDDLDLYNTFDKIFASIKAPICIRDTRNIRQNLINAYHVSKNNSPFAGNIEKMCISVFILELANELWGKLFDVSISTHSFKPFLNSVNMRDLSIEMYIFYNYNKNITLKNLADYLCLSEKQTNRTIKENFGLTFKQLLLNTRINQAKKLLMEGKSNEKIAYAVGYNSVNGFYRAFKEITGLTPAEFKNAYRDNHQ